METGCGRGAGINEPYSIVICIHRRESEYQSSCANRGSEALANALELQLRAAGLSTEVNRIECLGLCEQGPNLRIAPGGRLYHHFSQQDIPELIAELLRLEARA